MQVNGKVAVVTGGAQGLGRAFCEALLEAGAKVCFCDVKAEVGETTCKELREKYGEDRVFFKTCDVASQSEMEDLFKCAKETYGNIDIVCNNAGMGGEKFPLWERTVDVNLKGEIRGTLIALDYLRTDKGGSGGVIVNVSSVAALTYNPYGPVYAGTKGGVLTFSKSIAGNEIACNNGVRVNVLCPGFADTDLVRNMNEETTYNVQVAKKFAANTPAMSPKEVADAFMELVKDESRNGAILKCSKQFGLQYCTIEIKYTT